MGHYKQVMNQEPPEKFCDVMLQDQSPRLKAWLRAGAEFPEFSVSHTLAVLERQKEELDQRTRAVMTTRRCDI